MVAKYVQADFDSLFIDLATKIRAGGWEARQENPPQAYIHVSKPSWGDENMNGIYLEAYILGQQIESENALVALHCEGGCPFQNQFMQLMTERFQEEVKSSPNRRSDYTVCGPTGCSVFQTLVPFGQDASAGEVVCKVHAELEKLQGLAAVIDKTIADCKNKS